MSILNHLVRFSGEVTFTDHTGVSFVNNSSGETASAVTSATVSPSRDILYAVTWAVDPLPGENIEYNYDSGTGNYVDEDAQAMESATINMTNCDGAWLDVGPTAGWTSGNPNCEVYIPPFLHQSTFTDANGTLITAYTPDVGNPFTYERSAGRTAIQGNQAAPETGGTYGRLSATETGVADVSLKMDWNATASIQRAELNARVGPLWTNHIYAEYIPQTVKIYTLVDASLVQRGSFTHSPFLGLGSYALRFDVSGADASAWFDGVELVTYGAAPHETSTMHGFTVSNDLAERYDNFTVEAI